MTSLYDIGETVQVIVRFLRENDRFCLKVMHMKSLYDDPKLPEKITGTVVYRMRDEVGRDVCCVKVKGNVGEMLLAVMPWQIEMESES